MPGPDREAMLAIAAELERLGLVGPDMPGLALEAGAEHQFLAHLRGLARGATWRDVLPELPADWRSEAERRAEMGEAAYFARECERRVAGWMDMHERTLRGGGHAGPPAAADAGPRPLGFGCRVPGEAEARALAAALLARPEHVAHAGVRAEVAADWTDMEMAGLSVDGPFGWLVVGRTPPLDWTRPEAMAAWFAFVVREAKACDGDLTNLDYRDPAA